MSIISKWRLLTNVSKSILYQMAEKEKDMKANITIAVEFDHFHLLDKSFKILKGYFNLAKTVMSSQCLYFSHLRRIATAVSS